MGALPDSVRQDIKSRSLTFGLILGVVSIPTSFAGGVLGGCCPLGPFVSLVPLGICGALGGLLAAMFLDWSNVPHESAIGAGARVGLRAGLITGIIGAVVMVILAVVGAGLLGTSIAASDDPTAPSGIAVAGANIFGSLIAAVAGGAMATIGGTVAGLIGAAIKR